MRTGETPEGPATSSGAPGFGIEVGRRGFLALLGAGLVTGLGAAASASASGLAPGASQGVVRTRTAAQRRHVQPDAVFRVPTDDRLVAMSFDDGPDPAYTPAVLRDLHRSGAGATFFLVGVNALAHRGLVAELTSAGHSIGNHTYDHRELELLAPAAVDREIDRGSAAIVAAGGRLPDLFRPPRGFTDEVVRIEARRDRYRTVFWTLCLEHFVMTHGRSGGVAAMLDEVRPGAVLLAHDGGMIAGSGRPPIDRRETLEALPLLLRGLAAKRLRVVDVPTLLRHARPSS